MANKLYDYVTDTGVIIPDTSEVVSSTQEMFRAIFGSDVDLTSETPVGRIVEGYALLKSRMMAITAQNGNQLNENYATGSYLDTIASFYSIERKYAQPTVVDCTFTGVENTNIPAGTALVSSEGIEYTTNEGATIASGGIVTGVAATCSESGAVECPVGNIEKLKHGIEGVTSVTNETRGVVGYDRESDLSLRKRIKASKWNNSSFVESIVSEVSSIQTVTECRVWENCNGDKCVLTDFGGVETEFLESKAYSVGDCVWRYSGFNYLHYRCKETYTEAGAWNSVMSKFAALEDFDATKAYSVGAYVMYDGSYYYCSSSKSAGAWDSSKFTSVGVPIRQHSVMIVVDGEDTSQEKLQVAEAVFKTKSAGADMSTIANLAVGVEFKDPLTGSAYQIRYSRPEVIGVSVKVTVKDWSEVGSSEEVVKKVKSAVNDWMNGDIPNVDGLSLGQNVYAYEIGAAVSDSIPALKVIDVGVALTPGAGVQPTYVTQILIKNWQKARVTSEGNITVVCS